MSVNLLQLAPEHCLLSKRAFSDGVAPETHHCSLAAASASSSSPVLLQQSWSSWVGSVPQDRAGAAVPDAQCHQRWGCFPLPGASPDGQSCCVTLYLVELQNDAARHQIVGCWDCGDQFYESWCSWTCLLFVLLCCLSNSEVRQRFFHLGI